MRVLVAGAAGSIGSVVATGLRELGHDVAGLDVRPAFAGFDGEWFVADCTDGAAVRRVFEAGAPDAVVHLAGYPGEGSLPESFTSHVVSTAALLDAMVAHEVRRIVYASSNHAVGLTPRQELLGTEVRPRPDTFYGVAKVSAEALLQLYADRYGIDAVACRIGSFQPRPLSTRMLSTWLSHADAVRMVQAGLTAPSPGFHVLYGISANTRAWWDLEPGRAIGYEPGDDAEDYAADIPAGADDEAEGAFVGGPFTLPEHHRPALG